jgi:hypothetical protein
MPGAEKSFLSPPNSAGKLRTVRKCIRVSLLTTFGLWVGGWAYLGRYRPTKPQVASGMIYPLPFHGWTLYVRHFEYVLAGPLTWCVFGFIAVFVTIEALATRSKGSSKRGEQYQ